MLFLHCGVSDSALNFSLGQLAGVGDSVRLRRDSKLSVAFPPLWIDDEF